MLMDCDCCCCWVAARLLPPEASERGEGEGVRGGGLTDSEGGGEGRWGKSAPSRRRPRATSNCTAMTTEWKEGRLRRVMVENAEGRGRE
jgi:hypothetical protein